MGGTIEEQTKGASVKRLMTALAAAGLIAAGCTSGDTAADTTEPAATVPATTAAPETTAATDASAVDTVPASSEPASTEPEGPPADLDGPAPGVTDTTIKLGITYIDLVTTQASTNHGDYEATYRAVIDDLNKRGGINGRLIEPVIVPISLADGGNADAACVQLTEDDDVFAVVGFFLNDAPSCYLDTHQTAILGGTMTEDLLATAKAPWFSWEPGSDFDGDALRLLAKEGELDGTIGVYARSASQFTVDNVVTPTLADAGVNVAEVGINDAPSDDQVLTDAQDAAILQKFQASGVDTILAPGNNVLGILRALEPSGYRPRVVGTDPGTATAFAQDASSDLSVLDGFVSAGPYGPQSAQAAEPQFVACTDKIAAAGVDYYTPDKWTQGQPKPWLSAFAACTSVAMFDAIATKAGKNLNYATYQWAGEHLGETKLPGNPVPYFFGPAPHQDGDAPVYIWAWDPATKVIGVRDQ